MKDDLKSSLIEMYRTALEACEARDQAHALAHQIHGLRHDLLILEDECWSRGNQIAREARHE